MKINFTNIFLKLVPQNSWSNQEIIQLNDFIFFCRMLYRNPSYTVIDSEILRSFIKSLWVSVLFQRLMCDCHQITSLMITPRSQNGSKHRVRYRNLSRVKSPRPATSGTRAVKSPRPATLASPLTRWHVRTTWVCGWSIATSKPSVCRSTFSLNTRSCAWKQNKCIKI